MVGFTAEKKIGMSNFKGKKTNRPKAVYEYGLQYLSS